MGALTAGHAMRFMYVMPQQPKNEIVLENVRATLQGQDQYNLVANSLSEFSKGTGAYD